VIPSGTTPKSVEFSEDGSAAAFELYAGTDWEATNGAPLGRRSEQYSGRSEMCVEAGTRRVSQTFRTGFRCFPGKMLVACGVGGPSSSGEHTCGS
jgi:hypothetical protein